MNRSWIASVGVLMMVAGCADLSTEVPASFDLSGIWVMSEPRADPPAERSKGSRGGRHGGRVGFDPSTVPMIYAESMVIEQDATSMGIAYQNGAYRDVSWGERDLRLADVEAGWDGPDLVIQTETASYEMIERYQLDANGLLRVEIRLSPARGEGINVVNVYRRQ